MARTVLLTSPNCRATRRTAALSQANPTVFFKALAERRLARQLRHLLRLHPAVRTAHPIQLHHHRRAKLKTGQIPYLALVAVIGLGHLPPTARAHQLPIPTLAPYP